MKREDMTYRYLVLLVAATIALASCTKDEPSNDPWQEMSDTKISLNVVGEGVAETKLTDTGFEANDNINVFGMLVNDNGSTKFDVPYIGTYSGTSGTPLTFTYSSVTTDSEVREGEKVYASNYYWPKFDHCDYQSIWFYGYYAVNDTDGGKTTGPVLVTSTTGAPSFTYNTNVGACANVEDFLVAQTVADKNDVILNFKRPLAKVTFKVTYEDFIGTLGVDLNMPIISQRSFKYNDAAASEDGTGWTTSGNPDTHLKLKYTEQINGNRTGAVLLATCYLIPQEIKKFSIIWNYHKEAKDYSAKSESTGFLNLEAGKSYTVTLNIQKDHVIRVVTAVEGSTEVQKWITITNENTI